MNNSRTLMNPAPKDIENILEPEAQNFNNRIAREQLKFDVDNTQSKFQQWWSSTKLRLKQRIDVIEVTQFWKNPSGPFMIVSFITNIIILLFGGIIFFDKLPPEIQLFYNPVEETWEPENKAIHVIVLPFLILTMFLLQYRFIRLIFRNDRRLGITISWIMTLMNVFLLVAISQILSFYN